MEKTIVIASDSIEAEGFCDWLNQNGYSATIGNDTANYINGCNTAHDDDYNNEMNNLWNEYCRS